MKYFLRTFGCQQNIADSERLSSYYEARGFVAAASAQDADLVVINTCMVREQAEERVFGLVRNLESQRLQNPDFRIVVTGCLVGTALREPSGKTYRAIRERMPHVELLPIEDVGFEYEPKRMDRKHAWIPITHGCNNFCTFCIVPFARGHEVSRPYESVVSEAKHLAEKGFSDITLLGQNVNSYGSDLVDSQKGDENYHLSDGTTIPTVKVKHLGRTRIPTLFPRLLESVAKITALKKISFVSSNPWDFSDELISVIAEHENISRLIHLPVQSGDNHILKKMNRWYTREEYMDLIGKIRKKISGVSFSTDIIVGFPGETSEQFENTVDLCRYVSFVKSYTACYSPRPGTVAAKNFSDDIPYEEKRKRFHAIDAMVNGKAENLKSDGFF